MTEARDPELRDIHRRIDSLKEENERQYQSITEKLHQLEVGIARGGRFPPGAYGAAVAVFLAVVGQGALLYSELQIAKQQGATALALVEDHVKGVGQRYTQWALLDERLKNLEGRIVGIGPNGWHKSDHDSYAKAVDAKFDAIEYRLRSLEQRK